MERTGFAAALLAGAVAAGVAAEPSVPDASPPPILFAADNAPALSGDLFRLDANGRLVTRFVVVAQARGATTSDVYGLRTDGSDARRLTTNVDAHTVSWRR